ncbi:MAG: MBL fold metallo-hydrolase [Litorilinea sp.]
MYLKYFYDEHLAQASYLVGCVKTGEALVVDPAREIEQYIEAAAAKELKVTHVAETHIHADFVSGGRELAHRTGATLYLSDMGDKNWKYAYAAETLESGREGKGRAYVQLVHDGDSFQVGNVKIDVLHTPGHTPEHVALMVTDTAAADRPMGVFTGDFLFVGDVGRPDLLETAAGMMGTKEKGARDQFQSVARFKQLPDYLQIWPGHGAGSACGKALGAIPSTTLGYEKLFNPAFQFGEESEFVAWLLADQPEVPRYFAQMKRVNKIGPALLAELDTPQALTRTQLDALLAAGEFVVDLRPGPDFADSHLVGALSIPATSPTFSTYVGWFVDYDKATYLIVSQADELDAVLRPLRAIGVDRIAGFATAAVIGPHEATLPSLSVQELATRLPQNGMQILDVRGRQEYREEHIPGATNIPLGYLPQHLDELPAETTLVVHCASSYRSRIGASYLRAHGVTNVVNLDGSQAEWSEALPTESGS